MSPRCRACQCAARPTTHGEYGYLAAIADARIGIDPELCPQHEQQVQSVVNKRGTELRQSRMS